MKPKILIVADNGYFKNVPHFMINTSYGKAISKAGGFPLVALDERLVMEYAEECDGLLLVDGPEIHCSKSGEFYHPSETIPVTDMARESFEMKLCELMIRDKKPIFGIGRGMQMINVFFGGTVNRKMINPHLHATVLENKTEFVNHKIDVNPSSLYLNRESFKDVVMSAHTTCLRIIGEGLRVVVASPDGVAEAIEHKTLPIFGVQWHPELSDNIEIFEKFVSLCKE